MNLHGTTRDWIKSITVGAAATLANRRSIAVHFSAVTLLALAAAPARAQVVWDWSFLGTEQGTFTTDGTVASTASPGTFTITAWALQKSKIPNAVYGTIDQTNFGQGVQSFYWDGSKATNFSRSGGAYTNGSNFSEEIGGTGYGFGYRWGFFANSTTSQGTLANDTYTIYQTGALSLSPSSSPSGVPEIDPAGMASVLALVTGALGLLERRRSRR